MDVLCRAKLSQYTVEMGLFAQKSMYTDLSSCRCRPLDSHSYYARLAVPRSVGWYCSIPSQHEESAPAQSRYHQPADLSPHDGAASSVGPLLARRLGISASGWGGWCPSTGVLPISKSRRSFGSHDGSRGEGAASAEGRCGFRQSQTSAAMAASKGRPRPRPTPSPTVLRA